MVKKEVRAFYSHLYIFFVLITFLNDSGGIDPQGIGFVVSDGSIGGGPLEADLGVVASILF